MKAGEPVQHAYMGVSVSSANSRRRARIDSVCRRPVAGPGLIEVGDVVNR